MTNKGLLYGLAVAAIVVGALLMALELWSVTQYVANEKLHPTILLWPIPLGACFWLVAGIFIQTGDLSKAWQTVAEKLPGSGLFSAFNVGGRRAGDPAATPGAAPAVPPVVRVSSTTGDSVTLHPATSEPDVHTDDESDAEVGV